MSSDVSRMSKVKVWWRCKSGHVWQACVSNRSRGTGCPFCAGRLATPINSLAATNPNLAAEWHRSLNGSMKPDNVLPKSDRRAWWVCSKGHEWQASVSSRSRGSGCPYCNSKAACLDNCLETVNQHLAMEWHPIKNGNLTPGDVLPGSHKKVWWICSKGHEWQAAIHNRNKGNKCPYCARLRKKEG